MVISGAGNQIAQMQAGVRDAVGNPARIRGTSVHRVSGHTMIALMCAGALAPLATPPEDGLPAAAAMTGGGTTLSRILERAAARLRAGAAQGSADDGRLLEEIERAVFDDLVTGLEGTETAAGELRAEVAVLFEEIGALRVALEAVLACPDTELRDTLVSALVQASAEHVEFAGLLGEVRLLLGTVVQRQSEILRLQQEEVSVRRADRDLAREQFMEIRLLHELVETVVQQTRPPTAPQVPDAHPGHTPVAGTGGVPTNGTGGVPTNGHVHPGAGTHDGTTGHRVIDLEALVDGRSPRPPAPRPPVSAPPPGGPGGGPVGAPRPGPPTSWHDGCPYRGLWPFTEQHAEVFFGRERATSELLGKLNERLDGPGLVVVTGPSGAGKSSLLRAGLIPALAKGCLGVPGSQHWPRLVLTPTARPLEELAARLADLADADLTSTYRALRDEPERAHLLVRQAMSDHAARAGLRGDPPRLVLVVDQFEEVFRLPQRDAGQDGGREPGRDEAREPGRDPDDDARQAHGFIEALVSAATVPCGPDGRPAALVVLGVRGDSWGRCAADTRLAPLLQEGQYTVTPMRPEQLRLAVTGPARTAGLRVDEELVEAILHDLTARSREGAPDAGALPLLSQAMLLTWEHREGDRLTVQGYARTGGVAGAIRTSASRAHDTFTPAQRAASRRILTALTVISSTGTFARRRLDLRDLRVMGTDGATGGHPHDVDAVVEAFVARRLLVRDGEGVEIAHDVLLHAWPQLRDWLHSDRDALARYSHLVDEAARWHREGRDPSFLYRGTELDATRSLVERWSGDPGRYPPLPPATREFLRASTEVDTRARRQRRSAVLALAGLLVVAMGATAVAAHQVGEVGEQKEDAVSRQLAGRSDALRDVDPEMSRVLAAHALDVGDTQEARASARRAVFDAGRVLTGHRGAVTAVAFAPEGTTLASAGADHSVLLWDTERQGPPVSFGAGGTVAHRGTVRAAAFAPHGDLLLTAGEDRQAILWDVRTREAACDPLPGHTAQVYGAAFSPVAAKDGRQLFATADLAGQVFLWAWQDGHGCTRVRGPVRPDGTLGIVGLAFSPDGGTVATGGFDGTVSLWDVDTMASPATAPLRAQEYGVLTLAFSPDGTRLAAGGYDEDILLWDLSGRSPRRAGTLRGHEGDVIGVAFEPDGERLVSASFDGTLRQWDVDGGTQIDEAWVGHTGRVTTLAVSHGAHPARWDDVLVASGGDDKTVRLWASAGHRRIGVPYAAHAEGVNEVVVSRDRTLVASVADDGAARLWRVVQRGGRAVDLRPVGGPLRDPDADPAPDGQRLVVRGAAFHPADGNVLATADSGGAVVWWRVADRTVIRRLAHGGGTRLNDVAWSPDGHRMAVVGEGGAAQVWSLRPGGDGRSPAYEVTGRVALRGHEGGVTRVEFGPDGTVVATAGHDRTVRLWDSVSGRQTARWDGHTDRVSDLAFLPDGRRLVTSSLDQSLRLWDVATGEPVGPPFTGHTSYAYGVTVMPAVPGGRPDTIVSVGDDDTVRIWDLGSRGELGAPLRGHRDAVFDVAPLGPGVVVSGDLHGDLRLWDVAGPGPGGEVSGEVSEGVCAAAGRSLTRGEWRVYVPGQPYRAGCAREDVSGDR